MKLMTFLQLIYITIIPFILDLHRKNQGKSRWDCWVIWDWYAWRDLALKKRIIHEKDAFLLSDLLKNMKHLSELSGLTEPFISNTRTLKRRIIEKFSDDISFHPKDKYLTVPSRDVNQFVHSRYVNPCESILVIWKGKGWKGYDINK